MKEDPEIKLSDFKTNFTPEQVIEWLEGIRALNFELLKNNPKLVKNWEKMRLIDTYQEITPYKKP